MRIQTSCKGLLGTALLAAMLSGCKLAVINTEGGHVVSLSESRDCIEGTVCTFSIDDPLFSETFIAIPGEGYAFDSWVGGERFVCGDSTIPACNVTLTGDALAGAVVDSDLTYHAMPQFVFVDIDTDRDGTVNGKDTDDDNDGVLDELDPCPLDPDLNCT